MAGPGWLARRRRATVCAYPGRVPMSPEEFYAHAMQAADAEGRLPLSRMTSWDVFPFEQSGLRVVPLRRPVLPEPARAGENAADCRACTAGRSRCGPMSTGGCRCWGRPAPR